MRALSILFFAAVSCLTLTSTASAQLLDQCETAIEMRLPDPSVIRTIRSIREVTTADRNQWVQDLGSKSEVHLGVYGRQADALLAEGRRLTKLSLTIEYQAFDASGLPIQETASCTYMTVDSDESDATPLNVRVNGSTFVEWRRKR